MTQLILIKDSNTKDKMKIAGFQPGFWAFLPLFPEVSTLWVPVSSHPLLLICMHVCVALREECIFFPRSFVVLLLAEVREWALKQQCFIPQTLVSQEPPPHLPTIALNDILSYGSFGHSPIVNT